ncbi:MAG TPA: DUF2442 domain-containing protein [Terriglobia bacterium]|nr:DUF2442 domain-containing protein [Terriglobia bacterium]
MTHPIYSVVGFQFAGPYTLRVEFDDGTVQVIDFGPILRGELYGPLEDERLFRQVEIDPEVHTLVWPTGADFDPATLHDWPRYADQMRELAGGWPAVHTKAS